jgi:hypothetical protein
MGIPAIEELVIPVEVEFPEVKECDEVEEVGFEFEALLLDASALVYDWALVTPYILALLVVVEDEEVTDEREEEVAVVFLAPETIAAADGVLLTVFRPATIELADVVWYGEYDVGVGLELVFIEEFVFPNEWLLCMKVAFIGVLLLE